MPEEEGGLEHHEARHPPAVGVGSSGYANPYDHAMSEPGYTREWTGTTGRHDIVASVCGGSYAFCAQSVSDHAPIGVLFAADAADSD